MIKDGLSPFPSHLPLPLPLLVIVIVSQERGTITITSGGGLQRGDVTSMPALTHTSNPTQIRDFDASVVDVLKGSGHIDLGIAPEAYIDL